MLARREAALTEMRDLKQDHPGSLRVGITAIMGTVLFPSVFARFRRDCPHIQVTVIEEGSRAVRGRLERGELDLGIMITSDLPQTLQSITISSGRILACLPCDHPLGERDSISLNELRDEPFILFREDTYSRQIILEACTKLGFRPTVALTSSQMGTVLELIRRKVGISFFAEEALSAQRGILARPLREPLFLTAGLAWNRNGYLSKAAKAFLHSFQHT